MIVKFFLKKWPFTAKSWWTEYHPTLTDSSEKGISFLDLVIKKKKRNMIILAYEITWYYLLSWIIKFINIKRESDSYILEWTLIIPVVLWV
jgi:hypothetical protein